MSGHSSELACPAIIWAGVMPTDIRRLRIECQLLTAEELAKLDGMLTRPYMGQNAFIRKEVIQYY